VGGASANSLPEEQADRPPTPDPSPPRARARGGRGAHCAQLRDLAARFARVLPETSRPLQSEGAGNAGRPMRPIAARAMVVVERTRVSQVTPESPGIPHAMVLTASCVLSPVSRAFLPPSPPLLSANLTPASGCQDHTPSPSADKRRRLRHHPRPPHPAPRFVTLRNAPLSGRDGATQ
jgi:hypothetical protein